MNVFYCYPVTPDSNLFDAMKIANEANMFLVTKNNNAAICNVVPKGWRVIRGGLKHRRPQAVNHG